MGMDSARKLRREIYRDLAKWLASCKENGSKVQYRTSEWRGKGDICCFTVTCGSDEAVKKAQEEKWRKIVSKSC